jgi:hypothetical protein
MDKPRIFSTPFGDVYPMYVQKAERKGRTAEEVETFFTEAPQIHPNADKITGKVCGVQVETVADPIMRNIRRLDKLVDELAKGKAMEKVLRT